ncbi:phosphonate transport system substrate-binding protein [Shimia sagamensis]|uniref:Phosphonate transport system substrate-binding protein n=2 Tax=Shimia sagamensis TaxID=1566352 RepID=A0ABY1NCY5_9RHOB|nr:phosphonate transport system substrate-binding protein [Shimia sagamensis]
MIARITLCFAACLAWINASFALAETLNLGTLNEGIRGQMRVFQPLLTYLETDLEDAGITEVRLVVHPSAELMAAAIARKEVDIFIDSPLVVAKVAQLSGGTPFLRNWKGGHAGYYSVIFTHVNSGITALEELRGKRIALEDRDSSSGFIVPAHILLQSGLRLKKLRAPGAAHSGEEVGYFLTYNDKNTMFAVASGRADAGATNQMNYLDLMEARPNDFRLLAISEQFPRSVLMHRPGMSKAQLNSLRQSLTSMSSHQKGRDVLNTFQNSSGFDEFAAGSKYTFAPIFEILQDLEDAGIK